MMSFVPTKRSAKVPVFLFMAGCFLWSVPAFGEGYSVETAVSVGGEYSDNVAFERETPREDFFVTAKPSIDFNYLQDNYRLSSKLWVGVERYFSETDEDRENYEGALKGDYYASPRLRMNAQASYRRDTTQETQLYETGEVTARQDRDRYQGEMGLVWNFSETALVDLSYEYQQREFEKSTSIDYNRHTLSCAYRRMFNHTRDAWFVEPLYYYQDADNSKMNYYSLSLGWDHRFTETLKMVTSFGARYATQDYDGGFDDDNSGMIADISFEKKHDETLNSVVGYKRNLYTGINGGQNEVDQFYCNLNYRMLSRLRVGVRGGLYLRRQPEGDSDQDRVYFNVRPTLNYKLTERHSIEVGYSYENEYDNARTNERTVDRNRVWVMLNLRHSNIW